MAKPATAASPLALFALDGIGARGDLHGAEDTGQRFGGVNFGSQDYLSLSSHPAIKQAAMAAIDEYGVHSAGSAAFIGNTRYSLALEREVADFVGMQHAVLFPTGWAAGFGVIKALIRPDDHVVIDGLAHSCLQEGANAATRNVHYHGHLNIASARRHLTRIRERDAENAILVVTESLFSMDSDTPDIAAMQDSAASSRRRCSSTAPTISAISARTAGAIWAFST